MSRRNRKVAKPFDRKRFFHRLLRVSAWMLVVLCVGVGAVGMNALLTVHDWKITGGTPDLRSQIDAELTSMNLGFIHTSPAKVRTHLVAHIADLADVEVERRLPDMLYIHAVAEEPVALWQQSDAVWILGQSGNAYRQLQAPDHLDLPLVRVESALLPEAVRLLKSLKRQDPFRFNMLSECIAAAESDSWQLIFGQGQSWLLAQGGQVEKQISQLVAILHKKRWRGGLWRVDARLETRWFFRQAGYRGVI